VDIVWDTYKVSTIKDSKVTGETKIPPNWSTFLQDNTNKKELFALLKSRVANFQFLETKEVNITSDKFVSLGEAPAICRDVTTKKPKQKLLYMFNKQISVRTVDTNVLVILIGLFHEIIASYPSAAV